jgi:hypothetical protein
MLPVMKTCIALSCAIVLLGALSAKASSASTAREEIASRRYLIGTWKCTYTVGNVAGAYATTWANALDDRWLKQTYDQPAAPNAPGFLAEYFVGYDEARQAWVRFGAMTTGQYFAIRMADDGNGGWTWKYVSFFPRKAPETAGSDATLTKRSDTEYTVDGPTYPSKGVTVTEHHDCKKTTS